MQFFSRPIGVSSFLDPISWTPEQLMPFSRFFCIYLINTFMTEAPMI